MNNLTLYNIGAGSYVHDWNGGNVIETYELDNWSSAIGTLDRGYHYYGQERREDSNPAAGTQFVTLRYPNQQLASMLLLPTGHMALASVGCARPWRG